MSSPNTINAYHTGLSSHYFGDRPVSSYLSPFKGDAYSDSSSLSVPNDTTEKVKAFISEKIGIPADHISLMGKSYNDKMKKMRVHPLLDSPSVLQQIKGIVPKNEGDGPVVLYFQIDCPKPTECCAGPVWIKSVNHNPFRLPFRKTTTVAELREVISEELKADQKIHFDLYHRGNYLKDQTQTLMAAGIAKESSLDLVFRRSPPA